MMSDTFELREVWQRNEKLAKVAIEEASKRCEEYARTEAEYYTAKTNTALKLKAEGNPVTFIQTIVKGHEDVANALFEYQLAEGKYRAAMKAIDVYRDAARLAYDEYKRSMAGDNF